MAYASWSVTFGEQPSAAKWNILGTNDASFNDGSGIQPSNPIIAASGGLDLRGNGTNGVLLQLRTKEVSTANTRSSLKFEVGMDFIEGDGTSRISKAITFPTAFSTAVVAILFGNNGVNLAADPTTIADGTATWGANTVVHFSSEDVTVSGFTAWVHRSDSTVMAAGNRFLFSYLAIGY